MKVKNSLSLYSLGAQELEEIIEKELVRKLFKLNIYFKFKVLLPENYDSLV